SEHYNAGRGRRRDRRRLSAHGRRSSSRCQLWQQEFGVSAARSIQRGSSTGLEGNRFAMIWLPLIALAVQISFDAATNTVLATDRGSLDVYLGDAKTPMLGDVVTEGKALRFRPRFPLLADRDYRAVLRLSTGDVVTSVFHTGPAPAAAAP